SQAGVTNVESGEDGQTAWLYFPCPHLFRRFLNLVAFLGKRLISNKTFERTLYARIKGFAPAHNWSYIVHTPDFDKHMIGHHVTGIRAPTTTTLGVTCRFAMSDIGPMIRYIRRSVKRRAAA